jgi:pyruvate formate lyase activating enzyme
MSTGQLLVVDILRSSMNDGPGIRTTVFVKGCPLRCAWCHNPESQRARPELSFDAARCTLCGQCVEACPNKAHQIADGVHTLDRGRCQACGRCVQGCQSGALKIIGQWWSPDAVVEMALRDKAYYDRSGGGITISGGEPMSQPDPVSEVLRLSRQAGIHTCLDTSGQTLLRQYMLVLPHVDLFLWDHKATGVDLHRDLTGVDGELIMANLHALYAAGAKLRLRCPLVPGVNDTAEHLRQIAQLSFDMPNLDGIDILPYHSFGRHKAAKVGMKQADVPAESASPEQVERWKGQLRELGCQRVSVG